MEITERFILKELECPICFNYMQPPIPECVRGHSFCDRCFYKMDTCGLCREPLSETSRNLTLEYLHDLSLIPCNNRSEGCRTIKRGYAIVMHESWCMYGPKPCPLAIESNCEWQGEFSQMHEHLTDSHANVYHYTDRNAVTSREYMYCSSNLCYAAEVFCEHKSLFKLVWDMNLDESLVRFCVFLVHRPVNDDRFDFEVEIKSSRGQLLQFRRECPVISQNVPEASQTEGYLLINTDLVQDFVRVPEILFTVTILKRRQNISTT